jgi:glycosyltransferase involved in cell wall biosynthesis
MSDAIICAIVEFERGNGFQNTLAFRAWSPSTTKYMLKPLLKDTERIRVLHVIPSFVIGGAERCVVQLMCALDASRFEVAAVSLYARQNTELESILAANQFQVTYFDKKRGLDLRIWAGVMRVVQAFRPHVIHTHLHAFNYVLPVILGRRAPAFVHTVHTVAEREQRRLVKWIPELLFSRSVTPVAIATEVQASIRRVFGADSCLIPNGIPVASYQLSAAARRHWREREQFGPDDVIFVCVARFEPVKNHELLIRAFALASRDCPKAQLLLVGDGDLRSELERQVEALQLRDRVRFLGIRRDVPSVLNASDVYAFASNHEGSPLSVMEAMAAGLPIVGTSVGGVPEMVPAGRVGLLTEARDAESLAASMISLYDDGERRAVLASNAAQHAVRFDVATMAESHATLYANLLSGHHGAAVPRAVTGLPTY